MKTIFYHPIRIGTNDQSVKSKYRWSDFMKKLIEMGIKILVKIKRNHKKKLWEITKELVINTHWIMIFMLPWHGLIEFE